MSTERSGARRGGRRALALAVAATALGLPATACRDDEPRPGASAPVAPPRGPTFVPDSFDQLYPILLLRKLSPARQAAVWREYQGKYVRWTGTVVSFTPDGITFKHIPGTVTFDVSVQLEARARDKRKQVEPGDTVTYIGRLSSYDDIFRTFYLDHGDLAVPAPLPTPPSPPRR